MTKMLWELKAPLAIAKAKEDMGLDNMFKYLRYYRMFLSRFRWKVDDEDLTERIEKILFWRGHVAIVNDLVYGLIACEVDEKTVKYNPNGKPTEVDVSGENGYKKRGLKVGKDAVLIYADDTHFAPVLYIWAIANEIIKREDIINQQDNMLRKPILITGEGEELDNAMVKAMNILSGMQWINLKQGKKGGKGNIMEDRPAEVLNLQVGNAYKGAELWDSRKHFEELICDYLGYTTVKNEKRERMNVSEVNKDNSVGQTFYKSALKEREKGIEDIKRVFGKTIDFEELLEQEEVSENGNSEDNMGTSANGQSGSNK